MGQQHIRGVKLLQTVYFSPESYEINTESLKPPQRLVFSAGYLVETNPSVSCAKFLFFLIKQGVSDKVSKREKKKEKAI